MNNPKERLAFLRGKYNFPHISFILIGDLIRKDYSKKLFNHTLKDSLENEHLDIIVDLGGSPRREISKLIRNLKLKKHKNNVSYLGKVGTHRLEIVAVKVGEKLYDLNFRELGNRPDITIERIGIRDNGQRYDEFGRGFKDFKNKKIVLNPLFRGEIPLEKALKIIQIKMQTGFELEKRTKERIKRSLKDLSEREGEPIIKKLLRLIKLRSMENEGLDRFIKED